MPIQRDAFVLSSSMAGRVQRLNQAVRDCALLFVLAPSGSGKDRFFDWWWQEGCTQHQAPHLSPIDPNDIVLVRLIPPPTSAVPPACVTFTKIWHGLQELDRAQDARQRARPLGKPRAWITEQHILSLMYDYVHPLIDTLHPRAFVILNGEYLDQRTVSALLEVQTPIRRGSPAVAQRALIICVSSDPAAAEESKFGKMVNTIKELRPAWTERRAMHDMDAAEFQEVLLMFIRRNLQAVFADEIDRHHVVREAAEWTQGNWRLLAAQLIPLIDEELGPAQPEVARQLTPKIWGHVRTRWQKRQW